MSIRPFTQNVIAVIWDFEKTLIPAYMHGPLFERYGVDSKHFWEEVNALPDFYHRRGLRLLSPDTIYLSHVLTYVRAGRFPDLTNNLLKQLGGELECYPGLPSFMPRLKQEIETHPVFSKLDIRVEHYVVSTGLRQTILGSPIAPYVDEVWACELLESPAPPGFVGQLAPSESPPTVRDIGYALDNATKTRALFEINKGVNKHPEITINTRMPHDQRRVPFRNMICVADGPGDIPMFAVTNHYGGRSLAVYNAELERNFRQVADLLDEGRVQAVSPADYRPTQQTARILTYWAEQIAFRIAEERASGQGRPEQHEGEEHPR